MSFSWIDILFAISSWAAMVGAGFAVIITIIVITLHKGQWSIEQWRYAGIAFVCGFVLTFLVVPMIIYTR